MAGHSKWANIRFRKAAQDNRRGKLFSKLIREITVAGRIGGGEPESNPRLRAAIDRALGMNMSWNVINRAIQRGSGAARGEGFQDVVYEGYGPGGVAILIECSTDNRNRTVSDIRHALTKQGGNLGTEGSVSYLFSRIGVIQFAAGSDEEQIMDAAVSAGADDFEVLENGEIVVAAPVDEFAAVIEALTEAEIEYEEAEIEQRAAVLNPVNGEIATRIMDLVSAIEELDDVNDVYTNAAFSKE